MDEKTTAVACPVDRRVGQQREVELPGGIRLTVVERCELQDWKDACVDAAIKRTEAVWRERVRLLELAEEGAKDAFGTVVQQKRDLEKECSKLRSLLDGTHQMIREYASGQRLPNAQAQARAEAAGRSESPGAQG